MNWKFQASFFLSTNSFFSPIYHRLRAHRYAWQNYKAVDCFERRMSLLLDHATSGRLSKPYYSIEVMRSEIDDAFDRNWEEAYSQALEDNKEMEK